MGPRLDKLVALLAGVAIGAGYTLWIDGTAILASEPLSEATVVQVSKTAAAGRNPNATAPVPLATGSHHPKSTSALAPREWVEEVSGWVAPVVWPVRGEDPLPCFPPQRSNWEREFEPMGRGGREARNLTAGTGGMYFVKPMKVGGSTLAGVHIRLMHRAARRNQRHQPPPHPHDDDDDDDRPYDGVCRGNWRHGNARGYAPTLEDPSVPTLLWGVVRDPTARAVSQFFHFGVSREKIEPTDANFRLALFEGGPFPREPGNQNHNDGDDKHNNNNNNNDDDRWVKIIAPAQSYYANTLDPRNQAPSDPRERIAGILPFYDFIAVTERMDESLVVLKHLWDLEWGDLLYLSAKRNGGYDGGGSRNGCTWVVPSFVSDGMAAFFGSEEWLERIDADFALYAAANKSLDRTIENVVGRRRFEKDLRLFRHEHRAAVEAECAPRAVFPCSTSGEKVPRRQTNCLWADSACASDCLDEVAARIG